jgi:hypothetical protein
MRGEPALQPTDMSDAEGHTWLAGFEYQIVTWSAPLPDEEEEPPGDWQCFSWPSGAVS